MEEKVVKQQGIGILMTIVFLLGSFVFAKEAAEYVNVMALSKRNVWVVIDPGHGGIDPGKVGINGALEKDINLAIALKLKTFLEMSDVNVILTRDSDVGLYGETSVNKKVEDLKNRVQLIDSAEAVVAVSIHQNSYTQEYVNGAQVFYYAGSQEGEYIASIIQEKMREILNPNNQRMIKDNQSYYLLTETKTPTVIVECGFLSNYEEAEQLCDAWYQEKVAWAIHMGIVEYLNVAR